MIETISDSNHSRYANCHEYVTEYCHSYGVYPTKKKLKFVETAFEINAIQNELWSFMDFLPMKKDNYRKMLQRLKPIVEKVVPTNPALYRLKGIQMEDVTKYHTGMKPRGISKDFEYMLRSLRNAIPMMHDLHLLVFVSGLWEKLKQNSNFTYNSRNKGYTIKLNFNRRFPTVINIYKNKMQVMVGCTHQPLPYSVDGFLELSAHLGIVCDHLRHHVGYNFAHEPIPNWIVTYYHFNKDGLIIDSPVFNYTVTDLANHSVFYLKHFEDGTVRPRFEEHRTPQKSVAELARDVADE